MICKRGEASLGLSIYSISYSAEKGKRGLGDAHNILKPRKYRND